jgi:hypothetical protein
VVKELFEKHGLPSSSKQKSMEQAQYNFAGESRAMKSGASTNQKLSVLSLSITSCAKRFGSMTSKFAPL